MEGDTNGEISENDARSEWQAVAERALQRLDYSEIPDWLKRPVDQG